MIYDRNINTIKQYTKNENLDYNDNFDLEHDNYYKRLLKLIPSEIIAFYLAMDAIVCNMKNKHIMLWIVFLVSLIGAWVYIIKATNVKKKIQQIITLISFIIWVYVIGGPFQLLTWYDATYGKLLVTIYTFFIPFIYKPTE